MHHAGRTVGATDGDGEGLDTWFALLGSERSNANNQKTEPTSPDQTKPPRPPPRIPPPRGPSPEPLLESNPPTQPHHPGRALETALLVYFIIVLIYHGASFVLASLYLIFGWQGLRRERIEDLPDGPLPKLSVIIPARNEEANIGPCLASVLEQDYPELEILILDDHSEDRTRAIAEETAGGDARVTILNGEDRPDDWFGKPWALHCAQQHATGSYLLFVDADVRLSPGNLSTAMRYALHEKTDMLSLMGYLEASSFWEGAIQPIMGYIIVAFFPLDRVNSKRSRITMCNGQYILIRRETYDQIGGHVGIRSAILEDVALSRTVKSAGHRYRLLMAPKEFTCRMYSTFGQIWEGWSKNFFAAMQNSVLRASLAFFMLFFLSLYPLLDASARLLFGDPESTLLPWSLASAGAILFLRAYISILFRFPVAHVLTHPLGVLTVLGIMLNSVIRTLSGKGVSWKGRTYILER